ncbi:MAG: carbohydrate kinase family protein [bacterium]|jgi:sugar/nucleoside kinase (ribokinase family)
MPDLACIGSLVADLVGKPIDEYPPRGRLSIVPRMELHTGGCALNSAVAAKKIGLDAAVIGKVGADGLGEYVMNVLSRQGINVTNVSQDPSVNTSATMVVVHGDGERSFMHYIGANAAFTIDDMDWDLVKNTKILHMASALVMPGIDGEPSAQILKKAKELGCTTAMDTTYNPESGWMKMLAPSFPYVDYFLPSIEEARMITGCNSEQDMASFLLDKGVKVVALKMGENGSYVRSKDVDAYIPIYKVDAVDGTGAGDAYVAGFLSAIVKGWDLERAGRFASMVGACSVSAMGATTGILSMEDTLMRFEA